MHLCNKSNWQKLDEENRETVNEMAINLIERRKGKAYRMVIAQLFRNSPSHRAQVAPEYQAELQRVLNQRDL